VYSVYSVYSVYTKLVYKYSVQVYPIYVSLCSVQV
jgi:hypothetical protein